MSSTVDASVFIAAARRNDVHHSPSRGFLLRAVSHGAPLICPSLVVPECTAALARETGDAAIAMRLARAILDTPVLRLVPLDVRRAQRAAEIAATRRLKGADSVYVAVAEEFGCALVTWDAEILQRASGMVSTLTPDQWSP